MKTHYQKPRKLDGKRVWHPSHGWGVVDTSYEDDSSDVAFEIETAHGTTLRVSTSLLKKYDPPWETF